MQIGTLKLRQHIKAEESSQGGSGKTGKGARDRAFPFKILLNTIDFGRTCIWDTRANCTLSPGIFMFVGLVLFARRGKGRRRS